MHSVYELLAIVQSMCLGLSGMDMHIYILYIWCIAENVNVLLAKEDYGYE